MFDKAVGSEKLKLRIVKLDQLEQDTTIVEELKVQWRELWRSSLRDEFL